MGTITLNHITKIEGHARLDLEIKDGKIIKCQLGSIEGSRHFEALLKGRRYDDAPEITSRICGICSSAHGVVSVMAMENLLGIQPSKQTLILRELQTIGERIRSHGAHLYVLALPDYLGYESVISMLPKYKNEVARALRITKLGNDMVTAVSGRIMHQVSTAIGGFTHFPSKTQLNEFLERLIAAKEDIFKTAELFASLKIPNVTRDIEFFSLTREGEYATSYGDLLVGGKIYKQADYKKVFEEYHEPYSNANFVVKEGKSYYTGSLARINNNYNYLSKQAKAFMKKARFNVPCHNLFMNNLAQAVELIHHWETGIEVLKSFNPVYEEPIKPVIKKASGIAANEAPRGTLWHEYEIDDNGLITYANIVAPTTQSLRGMQDSIHQYVQQMLDKKIKEQDMALEIEKLIRTYDPCFSCATHFLKVNWKYS